MGMIELSISEMKVNKEIKFPLVRVFSEKDKFIGKMSSKKALKLAKELNTDLVMIDDGCGGAPGVKFMDFEKYKNNQKVYEKIFKYLFVPGIILYVLLTIFSFFGEIFEIFDVKPSSHYVKACSVSSQNCYQLKADFVNKHCNDGTCDNPYYERIYFQNGGHLDFEYCNGDRNLFTCWGEDNEDRWTVQYIKDLNN